MLSLQEQDVKDLIQEAVLALVERSGEWPRSPLNWVFMAVRLRRRRLARARARAASYQPQIEAMLESRVGPFRNPDEELEARERLLAVFWLLDQVKPSRRAVAQKHLLEPSSEEEIAAELGIALGTAKSQWRRAKEDMQAAINREIAANGERAWLACVLAAVASFWLWITGRRRARPSGAVLACAAIPFFASGHIASGANEPAPRGELAAVTLSPIATSTAETPDLGVPAREDESADTANAKSEISGSERSPSVAHARSAVGSASVVAPRPSVARVAPFVPEPLAKAREALRRGDIEEASAALRLYETTHPDPTADSLHRSLRIEVARRVHDRQ